MFLITTNKDIVNLDNCTLVSIPKDYPNEINAFESDFIYACGVYDSAEEAKKVLSKIIQAIESGKHIYHMPLRGD